MHDNYKANVSKIYGNIDDIYYKTGAKTTAVTAFANLDSNAIICITEEEKYDANGHIRDDNCHQQQAKAIRVLSEWGMRGSKNSFPRLRDILKYEENGDRKIMLSLMVH